MGVPILSLASGTWVQIYLGATTAFTETGMVAGQYHYRVSACASACGDATAPVTVTVTLVPGLLSAPGWISPQGTSTTGTFTLSWSLVSGRTSYQLQELAPGNWAWANQILSPGTIQSQSFTRPNGTYAYQIRTCNTAGCGDYGPIQTVTVAIPAAIATPENFNVNPARSLDGHAHLDWDNVPTAAVSYELQRRAQSNGTWANLPAPTASEFDDSILINGQYQYRVRACRSSNDCGNYAGPITLSVEIPIQPPAVVDWLTVSPTTSTNGAFTLSWPPSTGATGYRITETINGGEATYYFPTATAASTQTYAFTNRGNGVYVYTIAACKTGAAPPCSIDGTAQATVTVAVATGIAAPLWIQGPSSLPGVGCVEVAGGASYNFDIDWQSVAGATRYEVVEGDDLNGSYPNNPIIVNPTSNPTFQRLSLKRSRSGNTEITYNYGVRACNATTCSEERRTAYMCLTSPGGPQSPMATTGVRYLHTDALGSPVAETDEFGTVIKRTRYEPYGAPTDGVYVNGPGFTGHVTDAATGLTYMQQRYYDPLAGQFLSLDPVGVDNGTGGNFNRYWYANNNPYRFIDPDGRCPVGTGTHLCIEAKTFDVSRSGKGTEGTSEMDQAVKDGKNAVKTRPGAKEERLGSLNRKSDGGLKVERISNATTGSGGSADTASGTPPSNAEAIVHGHRSRSVADDPNSRGDADAVKILMRPNYAVSQDGRIIVHEAPNGRYQVRMVEGEMTDAEVTHYQREVELRQELFYDH